MLEYCKKVLHEVSFDIALFQKEFRKACNMLNHEERERLKLWVLQHFGPPYRQAVQEVFKGA